MAGIFDNLNQKLNNMPFAQSMGLLSAGTSMLAGDKISDSINQGLGVYQNFNQMSEEQKRKAAVQKLIAEGNFTDQEKALLTASKNPIPLAVQIKNQKAIANKPNTFQQRQTIGAEQGLVGKELRNYILTGNLPKSDNQNTFQQRQTIGTQQGLIGDDLRNYILTGNLPKSGSDSNSNNTALMNNFNFIKGLMPDLSDQDILSKIRGGDTFNLGNDIQIKGDFVITPDANSEAGVKFTVIPGSPTDLAQQKSANQQKVIDTAEQTSKVSQASSGSLVLEEIERAITAIEASPLLTTGLGAQLTSGIGGSPAANVRALIDPIKANIGFDRLQRMRKESPTGGALGQVAVRELEFLQSVFGSLDQEQSAPQLLENLNRLSGQYKTSMVRILNAAIQDQKDGVLNIETGEVINPLDYFSQSEIDMLTGNTSGDLGNFASQVEAAKTVYDLDRLSKMPNITSEDRDLLKKKLEQF